MFLSIFRHYYIQNVKDGIQIRVYKINKEWVAPLSQFISAKIKEILRKSQAPFRDKLRKLRLKQNNGFLIKKSWGHLEYFVGCGLVEFSVFPFHFSVQHEKAATLLTY